MRWWTAIAALGIALAACSPPSTDPGTTTSTQPTTTSTRAPSGEFCLAGDLPFERDGLVAALGGDAGDATLISQVRWDASTTCERLTITFGASSGAPAATLGPTAVSVIPYAGIVRVQLPPEIAGSAIADTLVEGSFIESAYVVRDIDGIAYLDIHGVEDIPVEARAFTTTSPATLVVDIAKADTTAIPVGITSTDTAVVLSPTPGASQYPIAIDGYVKPGLPSVHVQLIDSDRTVASSSISMPGYTDMWQSVSTIIEEGPIGSVVVFIGTLDGDDRPDAGALVSITME